MAKAVIRHLKELQGRGLVRVAGDESGMEVWVDSDHAGLWGLTGETRSRLGILITYNSMPVAWKTSWIKALCTSSAEAELYALSEAIKLALHVNYIGEELGIVMPSAPEIRVDASAALGFAEQSGNVGRMKHIDLRSSWVQDMRSNSTTKVKVAGTENRADPRVYQDTTSTSIPGRG